MKKYEFWVQRLAQGRWHDWRLFTLFKEASAMATALNGEHYTHRVIRRTIMDKVIK